MKNSKELYSDIFDGQADNELLRQTSALEHVYQNFKTPDELSWNRLQLKARQRQLLPSQNRGFSFSWAGSRPKFTAVMASLCLLILGTGGAFALANGGALDFLFRSNSSTQKLLMNKQFTPFSQQWTSNGYTIHLVQGYADANNVILGIVADAPHGLKDTSNYESIISKITLRTSEGVTLKEPDSRDALDTTNREDLKAGYVLDFDASAIQGNPKEVTFHMDMELGCSILFSGSKCEHQKVQTDIKLPFHPGKVVTPHQTVQANGKSLTLEKIVSTPSETRFYTSDMFKLDQPSSTREAEYNMVTYNVERSINGEKLYKCVFPASCAISEDYRSDLVHESTIMSIGGGGRMPYYKNMTVVATPGAFDKSQSQGTLKIIRYITKMKQDKASNGYVAEGDPQLDANAQPWVFTYTLP